MNETHSSNYPFLANGPWMWTQNSEMNSPFEIRIGEAVGKGLPG
ncbi:MAG: hypothetical protein ABJA32_10325 [Ginsengibacter sp.]